MQTRLQELTQTGGRQRRSKLCFHLLWNVVTCHERIYVFQMQIRTNNFVSKCIPNPKTDSFKIHILFKSKILSLLLGCTYFDSKNQKQKIASKRIQVNLCPTFGSSPVLKKNSELKNSGPSQQTLCPHWRHKLVMGLSPNLVYVKTIGAFIAHMQCLAQTLLSNIRRKLQ